MRIIIFTLFILLTFNLIGQERYKGYVTLETKERKLISGTLTNLTKDSIFIRNGLGRLSFSRHEIKHLINGVVTNIDRDNISEPFYFPTAISSGRGSHHYKNYFLFGHNFNFGMTETLDLSVGFELASIIFDSDSPPVFQVGAKYSVPISDKFHIGLAGKWLFNNEGGIVFFQFPITFGDASNNITFSPSLILNGELNESEFFIGGNWSFKATEKVRLISDFVLAGNSRSTNIALEFNIKNNFSLMPGVIWSNEFSLIPSMAMTIPFGTWK